MDVVHRPTDVTPVLPSRPPVTAALHERISQRLQALSIAAMILSSGGRATTEGACLQLAGTLLRWAEGDEHVLASIPYPETPPERRSALTRFIADSEAFGYGSARFEDLLADLETDIIALTQSMLHPGGYDRAMQRLLAVVKERQHG